jgi:hypothetical protein
VRRYFAGIALVVVSTAVWVAAAPAVTGPRTFSLLEVSSDAGFQPLGGFSFDRPPVSGDRFAVRNTLYRWAGTKKGARIGHDQVLITFITDFGSDFSHDATVLYTAQVYLPGGTLLGEGHGRINADGPSRATIPILGGTGIYADARGFVNVRDLGNGSQNKTNLEFHVLP